LQLTALTEEFGIPIENIFMDEDQAAVLAAEALGLNFRICSGHKRRHLIDQMKPLHLDAEVTNRVHGLFTTLTKTRDADRAQACVLEMLDLMPGIATYLHTEVEALLPRLSPACAGPVATLGLSTTSLSESMNNLLQQRSNGATQTLWSVRKIATFVMTLASLNRQDEISDESSFAGSSSSCAPATSTSAMLRVIGEAGPARGDTGLRRAP
jgi:hypothetical protein